MGVRCNKIGSVGFLCDWRRLNVMITRARRGLVVVGNAQTLACDRYWRLWMEFTELQGGCPKGTVRDAIEEAQANLDALGNTRLKQRIFPPGGWDTIADFIDGPKEDLDLPYEKPIDDWDVEIEEPAPEPTKKKKKKKGKKMTNGRNSRKRVKLRSSGIAIRSKTLRWRRKKRKKTWKLRLTTLRRLPKPNKNWSPHPSKNWLPHPSARWLPHPRNPQKKNQHRGRRDLTRSLTMMRRLPRWRRLATSPSP